MKLGRKFTELLLLVATLAVVAHLGVPKSNLNVDGVSIGMSYRDVLEIHGRPDSLGWEDGTTCLAYRNKRSFWFSQGRVVFASGRRLMDGERVVYKAGEPVEILMQRFGRAEELTFFDVWFPDSGVVISNYALENAAYGHSRDVGLRTTEPRPERQETPGPGEAANDTRWSGSDPWSDDYHENWYVGALCLGMSEEEAGGIYTEADVVFDGGFVRGFSSPKSAVLGRSLGHHLMSVGVEVGQRLDWDRKLSPHPNAEITYDGDIVTAIDLFVKDDELFEALGECE